MNISLMNDGNIYFLGFIFSPKLRILSCGDTLYQLRKKESDVLALLCERYPHPVSQDDFLSCVWEGGYVTPQSIAQVIRALRRNLQDKDKQIIVTIPKLGYRFGVTPSFDEPQECVVENVFSTHSEVETIYTAQYDTSCGQFVYDRISLINLTPISVNSLAISPCVRPKKKIYVLEMLYWLSYVSLLFTFYGIAQKVRLFLPIPLLQSRMAKPGRRSGRLNAKPPFLATF